MIDYAKARSIAEQVASGYESYLGTPAEILDELTTEHDWGWTFYCQAKDLTKLSPEKARLGPIGFLVDRITGIYIDSTPSGPKMDLMQLLYWRDQKLAEKK